MKLLTAVILLLLPCLTLSATLSEEQLAPPPGCQSTVFSNCSQFVGGGGRVCTLICYRGVSEENKTVVTGVKSLYQCGVGESGGTRGQNWVAYRLSGTRANSERFVIWPGANNLCRVKVSSQ